MPHGHFSMAGPYTEDPTAYNQRQHRERRQREERQERAEKWLAEAMAGKSFQSFDALVFAATRTLEILRGVPLDDDSRTTLLNASRAVWAGLAQRSRAKLEIGETGRVEAITFVEAA